MKHIQYTPRARSIARMAGRLTDTGAHVSPLANPQAFAAQHGLRLVSDQSIRITDGLRRLVVVRRPEDNGLAAIAGEVTSTRDDSSEITIEDLEFQNTQEFTGQLAATEDYFTDGHPTATTRPVLYAA